MGDVFEAAPGSLPAHGEPDDVELGAEAQLVGELLHVQGRALLGPVRIWIALAIAGSVEGQQVHPQLLHQLLEEEPTTGCVDKELPPFEEDGEMDEKPDAGRCSTLDRGRTSCLQESNPWM